MNERDLKLMAVHDLYDNFLKIGSKLYIKYENDPVNVPKPDFLSAVALLTSLVEKVDNK